MAEAATPLENDRVAALLKMFPGSTAQELFRFCRARPQSIQEAARMYRDHLEWRAGKGSPQALMEASSAIPDKYIRSLGRGMDGTPVIFVQGARYDETIAPELYVQACAHVIDSVFDPNSIEKGIVFIDTRPCEGWNNAPVHKMISFFKLACSVLPRNFPERMQRVVIYPLPWIFASLWRLVRNLLDPVTQDKFVVLSGSSDFGSPCPDGLNKFLFLDQLPQDAHMMHQSLEARVIYHTRKNLVVHSETSHIQVTLTLIYVMVASLALGRLSGFIVY